MDHISNTKRIFSRLGVAYGAFLLIGIVTQITASFFIMLVSQLGWLSMDMNHMLALLMTSQYLIGTPICYLIVKDMDRFRPDLSCRHMSGGKLAAAFFVCISVMYIGNWISLLLMGMVNGALGRPVVSPVDELVSNMDTRSVFLIMVVMAPVVEELLFRKLLIDRVLPYGDKTAILVSGVLFGLSHGNLYQFFYAFGLGVIFAYIYLNTGKLRYTILFHALINFLGSVVALHVMDHIILTVTYGLFMLIGVILGIVLFIINRKDIHFAPAAPGNESALRWKTVFLNWGMALFFAVSFVLFVLSEISG